MGDPGVTPADRGPERHGFDPPPWPWGARALPLAAILMIATGLRLWGLDGTSFWYDEVITMRVARADGPASLVERLDQLDGGRAPLHPLVLQAWLRVFGPSDLAGRSFSALCGIVTVVVIYVLGRRAFDERSGRWAAWLAAVCPPLVYYSREARMYAWLVLLTCLSWFVFLSFRRAARPAQCLAYGLLLTSLSYSHPLGLFMLAAHGSAYLLVRSALVLPLRGWLTIQLIVILAIVPWLGRYLDHGTDYAMPRYPLRFLLAVPIEYIGGNSFVLLACTMIIGFGVLARGRAHGRGRLAIAAPVENLIFMTWATVPAVLMYLYSYVSQPIFGPARYHLFIAPAYLILVAHGLARLPPLLRWPAAAAGLVLSLLLLQAYSPSLKADWRGLAAWLNQQQTWNTTDPHAVPITVVIHPSDPRFPREQLEAARYYLSPPFRIALAGEPTETAEIGPSKTYEVHCLSQPRRFGDSRTNAREFYGLSVEEEGKLSADQPR